MRVVRCTVNVVVSFLLLFFIRRLSPSVIERSGSLSAAIQANISSPVFSCDNGDK